MAARQVRRHLFATDTLRLRLLRSGAEIIEKCASLALLLTSASADERANRNEAPVFPDSKQARGQGDDQML
jgi:hypothetical protein